jgi:hypothetical protein
MISIETQDLGQGMTRDTITCFLELQEREIEEDDKSQAEEYFH